METNKKTVLTTTEVCERYNRSARTLARWQKSPLNPFPQPISSGGKQESIYSIEAVNAWEAKGGLNPA